MIAMFYFNGQCVHGVKVDAVTHLPAVGDRVEMSVGLVRELFTGVVIERNFTYGLDTDTKVHIHFK